MEEKKLTDEEIIASFECCRKNDLENTCAYCIGCPASNYYALDYEGDEECIDYVMRKSIESIHRQKAEIERLKKFEMFRIKTIKDLNKQIDEFVKIARVSDTKKLIETIKEQAVKDTAKEIFTKVKAVLNYLDNEWEISNALYPLEKEYGVEVE